MDKGIALYPIDWLPSLDDDRLVSGKSADHDDPPLIRKPNDFIGRHGCFPYDQMMNFDFFFADDFNDELLKKDQESLDQRIMGTGDYWRRLVLYRTFMQAMKIKEAAKKHAGQTILVVIGAFHKPDLEGILSDVKEIEIIQPSSSRKLDQVLPLSLTELFAIATFNLLGVQSKYGAVDWEWIDYVLNELESQSDTAEVELLRTRRNVLRKKIEGEEAIDRYRKISITIPKTQKLAFLGVKHRDRIDSYFDPFGYLTIQARAKLEMAREYHKFNNAVECQLIKNSLLSSKNFSWLQKAQIEGYWDEYVCKHELKKHNLKAFYNSQ